MRIIAGSAKGSQIFTPKGQDTRPTQDRVRESLFNILHRDIIHARVLDLFAGSGALSLESISRGAEYAVAVDCAREAARCIRRNVEKLGFTEKMKVLQCDFQMAISKLKQEKMPFDLVFLDPPYRMVETGEICRQLMEAELLSNGALVVVEHHKGKMPVLGEALALRTLRSYGDTEISFFDYKQP